jgi:hypothetical protein
MDGRSKCSGPENANCAHDESTLARILRPSGGRCRRLRTTTSRVQSAGSRRLFWTTVAHSALRTLSGYPCAKGGAAVSRPRSRREIELPWVGLCHSSAALPSTPLLVLSNAAGLSK